MKTTLVTVICAFVLAGSSPAWARETPSTGLKIVDATVVRPVCFVSTVAGGAVFVLSLPITAIRKEIKPAANELVHKPFWKTFRRPLGDMDAMAN